MKTIAVALFCLMTATVSAGNYEVSSPNGKVKVTVNTDETVKWSVDYDGRQVLLPSTIDISLTQGRKTLTLGKVGKVANFIRSRQSAMTTDSCCFIRHRSSLSR